MSPGDKKISQFTAAASLADGDKFAIYDASSSGTASATGTVVLAWLGASLDMSTIASGGALPVARGGSGRATGTTAYSLVATGTTATGAQQTLANGATTEVLVGGCASALPVWTTATGSGAPDRATSPTLVTPALGTPSSGTLSSCNGLPLVAGTTGTLSIARGGTGATSLASGYIPYSSGGTAYAASPLSVSGSDVGVGTTPWESLSIPFNEKLSIGSASYPFSISRSSTGQLYTEISDGYDTPLSRVNFVMRAGSASEITALSILGTGSVGVGTASFGTSAAGVVGIANGTAPSSSPANMVQLYAEDVTASSELKVRDEGGTVTVISPHPGDAPDALEYLGHGLDEYSASKNMYRGECYWFNRSKFYYDDTASKSDCRMVETFDEYNARRGLSEGDKGFLVKEDWEENQAKMEAAAKEAIANAEEHNASIPEFVKKKVATDKVIEASKLRREEIAEAVKANKDRSAAINRKEERERLKEERRERRREIRRAERANARREVLIKAKMEAPADGEDLTDIPELLPVPEDIDVPDDEPIPDEVVIPTEIHEPDPVVVPDPIEVPKPYSRKRKPKWL